MNLDLDDSSSLQRITTLTEALCALERLRVEWLIEAHVNQEEEALVSLETPLSHEALITLSSTTSPELRRALTRLLPSSHSLLDQLIGDPDEGVWWAARRARSGAWSAHSLAGRLGRHERLELPSARPPYGLRAFDELPSVTRVGGALALCQARFDVNLGVAMRSAEAAGLAEVFVIGARSGSLSSARGAEHALPITWLESTRELIVAARHRGYQLVAVQQTPDSEPYHRADYPPRPLFVLGSEDVGLPDELRVASDLVVEIPLYGAIDSLNVATAATCVMMHWRASLDE